MVLASLSLDERASLIKHVTQAAPEVFTDHQADDQDEQLVLDENIDDFDQDEAASTFEF